MAMLNYDLSSKDDEIAMLRATIKRFKEYDAQRKEYIKSLQQEIGALKAYIDELEYNKATRRVEDSEDMTIEQCKERIKNQKTQLGAISKLLAQYRALVNATPEELEQAGRLLADKAKEREYERMKTHVQSLRAANSELVCQLQQMMRKQGISQPTKLQSESPTELSGASASN